MGGWGERGTVTSLLMGIGRLTSQQKSRVAQGGDVGNLKVDGTQRVVVVAAAAVAAAAAAAAPLLHEED